jgi:O-succinylbenzoate synthase
MKIHAFNFHSYIVPLKNGQNRSVFFLCLTDEKGNCGWGEIAPLIRWSKETIADVVQQLKDKQSEILQIQWSLSNCFQELDKLKLFPSVLFGLESALLSILNPLPPFCVPISALLMGSSEEILAQAKLRYHEGFTSAKLKVNNLSFEEAACVIYQLKDWFRLRIDVNRAWNNVDSLRFFAQFPLDTFDYVEEPFQNPHELGRFPHPLAIDESFPDVISARLFTYAQSIDL